MSAVAVLVPVLARPDRVAPLLASLRGSIEATPCRAVFIVSPDDEPELAAVLAAGADHVVAPAWPPAQGQYAKKINLGYRETTEPWVFLAADDLCFCPGWADRALDVARRTGKRVIGTNDLGNARVVAGLHSTHTLVARSYADDGGVIDEPGGRIYCESYSHSYCDDEMVQTAKVRNEFAFAFESWVEHLHPDWGKGNTDETYRLGQDRLREDQALFESRRNLWLRARGGRPPVWR